MRLAWQTSAKPDLFLVIKTEKLPPSLEVAQWWTVWWPARPSWWLTNHPRSVSFPGRTRCIAWLTSTPQFVPCAQMISLNPGTQLSQTVPVSLHAVWHPVSSITKVYQSFWPKQCLRSSTGLLTGTQIFIFKDYTRQHWAKLDRFGSLQLEKVMHDKISGMVNPRIGPLCRLLDNLT